VARKTALRFEAVGEQAVLESETIDGNAEGNEAEDPSHAGPPTAKLAATSEPSTDEWLGRVIHDCYRIVRALGRGGMGTVYLAEHTTLRKPFAVKLLNPRYASRSEFSARFLLEAQAVSRIDHPNVVSVVHFGTTPDGATFLVMEYLAGEPLASLCRTSAPLPWSRVQHLMGQVCRALQAAHTAGVVHRDIKPDNVIRLTREDDVDFVKVLDFGLAKLQDSEGLRLTRTGMVLGTPRYMAPEQARGAAIDHRVDIYAAGILYYELLCGRTPFQATSFMAMRNQHLLAKPEPPSHWAAQAGITDEMDAIALRALAKDPAHRFASMAEMAEAIANVGRGRGPVKLLERETRRIGLSQVSLITERGRANTGYPGATNRAAESIQGSSVRLPRRTWVVPTLIVGGVALVTTIAISSAMLASERGPTPALELEDPVVEAPDLALAQPITPGAVDLDVISLTFDTNVPVRVLEATDFAILGDTRVSPTLALPRSATTKSLILRAAGHFDLPIEIVPDRDRRLAYTLTPMPAAAPSGASTTRRRDDALPDLVPEPAPPSNEDEPAEASPEPTPPEPTPAPAPNPFPEIRDPFAKN
jgi:serine/threonine-protein kinase